MFSGSVRANLDPFGEYGDDQVWWALDRYEAHTYIFILKYVHVYVYTSRGLFSFPPVVL
jgi:ABC-type multidrug transport system fused ATPase/permease subunit